MDTRSLLLASIVLAAAFDAPCSVCALTSQDLQNIKCKVFSAIDAFQGLGPQPLLAKCVRLAFHDCVGGCDGVIDLKQHGNEGLDVPINQLQGLYNAFEAKGISRADFWAAAGTFAIWKGALNAADPNNTANLLRRNISEYFPPLNIYSGRTDGSGVRMNLPNPHGGISQVVGFFKQTFNMTVQDSVAIMGAHTLGGASKNNSGFDG
jgi:cytochrome c peroxidase